VQQRQGDVRPQFRRDARNADAAGIVERVEQGGSQPKPLPPGNRVAPMDIIRILLAIVLPPLGVFLQVGLGLQFWLNILLTLLGYIPGIIHALWVILRT